MKSEWKRYVPIVLMIFLMILAIVYWPSVAAFLGIFLRACLPVILGLVLAYLINILMSFYERHFFPKSTRPIIGKIRRPLCLIGALLTFVMVVGAIFYLVFPELISAIGFLANQMAPAMKDFLESDFSKKILPSEIMERLAAQDWKAHLSAITNYLLSGLGSAAGSIFSAVASFFSSAIAMITGIIFAVYLLLSKEKLRSRWGRLCQSFVKPAWRKKMDEGLSLLNRSFHHYIVGQCTEAVILGSLCALGMMLFGFPYAGMIGALVGFTALIPIAGAYIGAGVGAIMMLTVSPIKAVLFLVFIIVLQQLEGNLIFPRVVGGSIGLPAIWVLAAVSIGGGLLGILGMVLGVPLASALYQWLGRMVKEREEKMGIVPAAAARQIVPAKALPNKKRKGR